VLPSSDPNTDQPPGELRGEKNVASGLVGEIESEGLMFVGGADPSASEDASEGEGMRSCGRALVGLVAALAPTEGEGRVPPSRAASGYSESDIGKPTV
jgi:hypothetical protein